MRQRRVRVLGRPRRELVDPSGCKRRKVLLRGTESVEGGPAWLVGERDLDLRASAERLEQGPFSTGQVLEAVRKHRLAVPGVELRGEPLRGATAQEIAVPEPVPVELGAVGAVEAREIALELARIE